MTRDEYFAALAADLESFATERRWNPYHQPANLAASVAIEAAELLELFQWEDGHNDWDSVRHGPKHQRLREELADVLIYAIRLANLAGIDIPTAIADKMQANAARFPVPGGAPYEKPRTTGR